MKIYRVAQSEKGTFGVLVINDIPVCLTLEDPWNDNKTGVSCIPEGVYNCARHNGTRYKNVWEVKGVPKRSAILIHAGNTIDDTMGCILVGKQYGTVNGKYGIIQSGLALDYLRTILPSTFEIEIINSWSKNG